MPKRRKPGIPCIRLLDSGNPQLICICDCCSVNLCTAAYIEHFLFLLPFPAKCLHITAGEHIAIGQRLMTCDMQNSMIQSFRQMLIGHSPHQSNDDAVSADGNELNLQGNAWHFMICADQLIGVHCNDNTDHATFFRAVISSSLRYRHSPLASASSSAAVPWQSA